MAKNKNKSCKYTSIGGQALIEGIMMRGPQRTAMSCRLPDGAISTELVGVKSLRDKSVFFRIPIIRGIVGFIDALLTGYKTLTLSAERSGTDVDDEELSPFEQKQMNFFGDKLFSIIMAIAAVLGVALAFGLFFFVPTFLFNGLGELVNLIANRIVDISIYRALFEGIFKIAIFVLYIYLIGKIKDIKRVFKYHGAEHKSIFCYEAKLPLTVENVRRQSRFHPRCGTSFMIVMLLISIFISFMLSYFTPLDNNTFIWVIIKLLMIPIIMGLGYEFIKYAGKHDNTFTRICSAPGLWMQRLTTKEPDDEMIEVAICALNAVDPLQEDPFTESDVIITGRPVEAAGTDEAYEGSYDTVQDEEVFDESFGYAHDAEYLEDDTDEYEYEEDTPADDYTQQEDPAAEEYIDEEEQYASSGVTGEETENDVEYPEAEDEAGEAAYTENEAEIKVYDQQAVSEAEIPEAESADEAVPEEDGPEYGTEEAEKAEEAQEPEADAQSDASACEAAETEDEVLAEPEDHSEAETTAAEIIPEESADTPEGTETEDAESVEVTAAEAADEAVQAADEAAKAAEAAEEMAEETAEAELTEEISEDAAEDNAAETGQADAETVEAGSIPEADETAQVVENVSAKTAQDKTAGSDGSEADGIKSAAETAPVKKENGASEKSGDPESKPQQKNGGQNRTGGNNPNKNNNRNRNRNRNRNKNRNNSGKNNGGNQNSLQNNDGRKPVSEVPANKNSASKPGNNSDRNAKNNDAANRNAGAKPSDNNQSKNNNRGKNGGRPNNSKNNRSNSGKNNSNKQRNSRNNSSDKSGAKTSGGSEQKEN